MGACSPQPVEDPHVLLVVVDPDPPSARRWLSPVVIAKVEFVWPDEAQLGGPMPDPGPVEVRLGLPNGHAGARETLTLPLDGPESALAPALQAISKWLPPPLPVLVTTLPSGLPPAPLVLAQVAAAGFLPGVDLRRFEWVTDDYVWVARPKGVTLVPHRLGEVWGWRDLARLLTDLECVSSGSPAADWLGALTAEASPPPRETWAGLLRAAYIERAVTTIRDR